MNNDQLNNQLLEYWTCPKVEADNTINPIPVGFVSTSFTFDAEFFEEECLTRFLSMETEKENDGAAFLIEREEKLAGMHCGMVLVDQLHCKGSRSLRWDLVSCRVKNGILHSKITILQWSHCIRLIIASANLTKSGYCINQEVFAVFDYSPNADENATLITGALDFVEQLVNNYCGDLGQSRFTNFKKEVSDQLSKWSIEAHDYKKDEVGVEVLFVAPGRTNAIDQLKRIWAANRFAPADKAFITSPFFDPAYSDTTPSVKIFELLKQRGELLIEYGLTRHYPVDEKDTFTANAPDFLKKVPRKDTHDVAFIEIPEVGKNESDKEVPRPLHAKAIWICNYESHMYMIGSSNFTSPALALGKKVNYEANVVFCCSKERNPKAFKQLEETWVNWKHIDSDINFQYRENADSEDVANDFTHLPEFFEEAILSSSKDQILITLRFTEEKPPENFQISLKSSIAGETERIISSTNRWLTAGQPKETIILLEGNEQPDYLNVSWEGSTGKAYWPVIIESQLTLPPVEALRNLPLEALLQILSSNQPLHRLLKIIEKLKASNLQSETLVVDFHKQVDTSGFLIQRTRRISYAMNALRERIEKPAFTQETLNWRLNGPIGVKSLIEAIRKEAVTPIECQFLLAELALELSRINPKETGNSIKAKEVRTAVKKLLNELLVNNGSNHADSDDPVTIYSTKALQKAYDEL